MKGHAHRPVRFRPAAGADRAAARRAARRGAAAGRAAGRRRELEDRGVRDLPDLLRAGDALVVNDTKVIPAQLARPAHRARRSGAGDRGDAAPAARRLALARLRQAGASGLAPGDVVRFGDEGKVCFLGQLDATVEAKGEGGEVTLAFAFHGAGARPGDRGARRHAAAALYRVAPRRRRAGPRRLSDHVRARGRLGRGADRGTAFHRGSACTR